MNLQKSLEAQNLTSLEHNITDVNKSGLYNHKHSIKHLYLSENQSQLKLSKEVNTNQQKQFILPARWWERDEQLA